MHREEATSALAGFHTGPLSCSNWNLECWVCEGRKTEELREKPSEQGENQQQTQP